jgi:hypothetical protein
MISKHSMFLLIIESEMSHFYQKAKVYDLVVIAKDRGTKTSTTAKVYVEHRIQG